MSALAVHRRLVWLLLFLAACGGGSGSPPPPIAPSLGTFQPAALVLGQPDFQGQQSGGGAATGAATLQGPGAPLAAGGRLYVPDIGNNRVLGYLTPPATNGAPADFVLGQPGFSTNANAVSATGMDCPTAVTSDRGILYVAEFQNHRVTIFRTLPDSTATPADAALGQGSLDTNVAGANEVRLNGPVGLCACAGRLLVADAGNHRVLLWNALPTSSGVPADVVLGQVTFTQSQSNRGAAADATTLSNPLGVWTDGTRVAVADKGNNRVLIWNSLPTVNGQPADVVLGQSTFTSVAPASGATGMRQPSDVCGDGGALLVADGDNHRLLLWSAVPVAHGTAADVVLGQGDFFHVAFDDDDQDGAPDPVPSARTFDAFGGFLFARISGGHLWVGDFRNHRVLRFDAR